MLTLASEMWADANKDYPARCRVTTDLNIRSNPTKNSSKLGLFPRGEIVLVEFIVNTNDGPWGVVAYKNQRGYVSMRYAQYLEPEKTVATKRSRIDLLFSNTLSFIEDVWLETGLIIIVLTALILLTIVGMFLKGYSILSYPIYWLNRLEHLLVEPWRYLFRHDWVAEWAKPLLRLLFNGLSVIMYIVTTPLRLFNAIIYNILIHCITSFYDFFIEVFVPCDPREGYGSIWRWIIFFFWRLLKYPIYHGILALIESGIWTVIDIFIPARTLYHGTDLAACEAITGSPNRNHYRRRTSKWSTGTFLASTSPNCSWAGRGVYFAINRRLALGYSQRASEFWNDPVMIACRVSMGRVINYTLTPGRVYRQAGHGGNHDELNKFGEEHHYTTGEWYNNRGYWEYCLFDWQNRYNYPWRIRPIYILNICTRRAQHISGGVQHWLFDKAVLNSFFHKHNK